MKKKTNSAPLESLLLSMEFLEASKLVLPPPENELEELKQKISFPAYFLVGHSIELSLKAFLLGRGLSNDTLRSRKYGHNLTALMKEARRRKLGAFVKLKKNELVAIETLNDCYSNKEFEYTVVGYRHLPHYSKIFAVARQLCIGVKPFCIRLAINSSSAK